MPRQINKLIKFKLKLDISQVLTILHTLWNFHFRIISAEKCVKIRPVMSSNGVLIEQESRNARIDV